MAHYAFLDDNNLVTRVIVGSDESVEVDWEQYYGDFYGERCKRTSYNTVGGVHQAGGFPFRKNYAGVGFSYDELRDAFIPPQPYPSWIVDEETCLWVAPVPMPDDGSDYEWDDDLLDWVLLNS